MDMSQQIMKFATLNQIITKSVGQSDNQYIGNLGSFEVWRDASCSLTKQASQASDRYYIARMPKTAVVPTRGNSIKRTQTSLRPGALGPGGSGIDVKHNSYARYLAKKRGGAILGEKTPHTIKYSKKTVNNKFMKSKVIGRGIKC